jgi:hypothetical protein
MRTKKNTGDVFVFIEDSNACKNQRSMVTAWEIWVRGKEIETKNCVWMAGKEPVLEPFKRSKPP